MGLVKAIIILTVSIIVSEMFLRVLDKNKTKPGIKQIKPYQNCFVSMIFTTILKKRFNKKHF